jgi:hypothetical protein
MTRPRFAAAAPLARRALARRALAAALLALAALAGPAQAAATNWLSGTVRAFATNQHTLYVGDETRVIVRGDGDTDLDCWLYNPAGRLVSSDTDSTDICVLDAPDYGTHRLVIHNLGDVYNNYVIHRQ